MMSVHAWEKHNSEKAPELSARSKGLHNSQSATSISICAARFHTMISEEVGLLHDSQELLFVHLAITVAVGFVDHLLKLLIGHSLAELLRHSLQILEGDLARLVIVEEAESLQDPVLRVPVQDLVRHHLEELLVPNGA